MSKFFQVCSAFLFVWLFLAFSLQYAVANDDAAVPRSPVATPPVATPPVATPPVATPPVATPPGTTQPGTTQPGSTTTTTNTTTTSTPSMLIPLSRDNSGESYPGVAVNQNLQGSQGVVSFVQAQFGKAKQLLGPVLVFLIVGFGIRLIVAGGNEEEFNKAAKHFLYLLVGTAIVIFSKSLTEIFFLYDSSSNVSFLTGTASQTGSASKLVGYLGSIVTFLKYVFGGIAMFYVIKSGSVLIFNADDEAVSQQKEVFMYGFVGFIVIIASEAFVKAVFGLPQSGAFAAFTPGVDITGGTTLLSNITNLLLGMLSGLFLFTLVIGGVMYAMSAGNEERGQKATKMIMGSLMGLVIAFSSYTLVAEFTQADTVRPTTNNSTPAVSPPAAGGGTPP